MNSGGIAQWLVRAVLDKSKQRKARRATLFLSHLSQKQLYDLGIDFVEFDEACRRKRSRPRSNFMKDSGQVSPFPILESRVMNLDITEAHGACHCGAVRFNVRLADGLRTARRCTCSYCRMRGAVAVSANLDDIEITQGKDALTLYRFGTMAAKHYFCSRCGIYTHHQRRSNPHQYGINVACLNGLSPFDFDEVPVNDGVHHPTDAASNGPRVDGVLRYVRDPT